MKGNSKQLLELLRRLAAAGSGMPNNPTLVGLLPIVCSEHFVALMLDDLRQCGEIEKLRTGYPGTPSSWRLVESGQELHGDRPVIVPGVSDGPAQRRCLKGNHLFASTHKGNRICDACKATEAFHAGVGEYGLHFGNGKSARRPVGRLTFV